MNKRTNQAGINLIKKFEGFSNTAYKCPANYLTVGYGHRVKPDELFTDIITKEYAEKLLKLDLISAENCVNEYVHRDLTDNQFSALVCITYNIGNGAFRGSTLCGMLNQHKSIEDCAKQFLRWNKINGTDSKGLTNRREAEMLLFLK